MVAISVKLFRTHCNSARAKCICADSISGKQKLKLCEMGYQVKAMYFLFASVKSNTVLFAYITILYPRHVACVQLKLQTHVKLI